jgi:hypothetical protein
MLDQSPHLEVSRPNPNADASVTIEALLADYLFSPVSQEHLLAVQALQLVMRVDRDLREARAQWNQDWFRRLMRLRRKVIRRLHRRLFLFAARRKSIIGLLRRRYHPNIAMHHRS